MKQENTRRITNLSKDTEQIYYLCLYIEYNQWDNSKFVTRTHNSKKKRHITMDEVKYTIQIKMVKRNFKKRFFTISPILKNKIRYPIPLTSLYKQITTCIYNVERFNWKHLIKWKSKYTTLFQIPMENSWNWYP